MASIERKAREFSAILGQLGYRKLRVYVRASEFVTLMDLNWSGGTKSEYHTFQIDGAKPLGSTERYSRIHPANNYAEGVRVPIPRGAIVVETGFFCGKESTATIYINPADMPLLIPTGG